MVQLSQILSVQLIFSAAYSFRGSIQLIRSFEDDSRRENSKWVGEINILLIQIVCVCGGGSYEGCMFEVKFVQLEYMMIC